MFSSYQPKNSFDEYFKDNVNSAREILIPLLSSLDNMGLEELNSPILSKDERSGINISLAELTLSLKYSSKLFLG